MRLLFFSAVLAFAIDQGSKLFVMFGLKMEVGDYLDILPPLLTFRFGWNDGINFGLFGDGSNIMRYALIGLAVAVSIWLVWWARRSLTRPVTLIAAGFIIGGALANALDRVLYGAVADFLNMSCCGIDNPFIFNIADIFIFAGALGLVIFDEKKRA